MHTAQAEKRSKAMIKESLEWYTEAIRKMCINHGFYTCGDCFEYEAMLRFVSRHPCNIENMTIVAKDIIKHSEYYGNIPDMIFNISNEAVTRFYDYD